METIAFSTFSSSGVNSSDTFNVWRQKTNGIIAELADARSDLSPIYAADGSVRFATLDTAQTITGVKTFSGTSDSTATLKIGNISLFNASGALSTSAPVKVDSIETDKLKLNLRLQFGTFPEYSLPTTNPTDNSILSKNGSALSWTTLASIISSVQSSAAATVVSTNEIVPVGTIAGYSGSGLVPAGWLRTGSGTFNATTYPDLAAALGNNNLPNIANSIIKAIRDRVVNTFINRGNVFDIVKSGASIPTLSITDGGSATLNLLHDGTLTINANRQLGIANNAITTARIEVGSVTADRLSTGGPNWSVDGTALYVGAALPANRVATEKYVDDKIFKTGPAARLASKSSASRHSSVSSSQGEFCYINHDGVPIITGDSANGRFGGHVRRGHCHMPLPNSRRAVELHVSWRFLLALDETGQLWAMGINSYNMFNTVPNIAKASTWTLAFTPLYVNNGRIAKVVVSQDLDAYNVAVIDSTQRLWIAGYNGYGQLGNGTTVDTSAKPAGETAPVLTDIVDALLIGREPTTCIVLKSTGLFAAGYGGSGLMGNSTTTAANKTFARVLFVLPAGQSDYSGGQIYAGGENKTTSAFFISPDKTQVYGWGAGTLGILGNGSIDKALLPVTVFQLNIAGTTVEKIYTTVHNSGALAAYLFVKLPDNSYQLWCSGVNTGSKFGISGANNSWRLSSMPAGFVLKDFWCGNGYLSSNVNFVRAQRTSDGKYYLLAAGRNAAWSAGNGENDQLTVGTWSQISLKSDIVEAIADIQTVDPYQGAAWSILLLNDGSLYFSGYDGYGIDPGGQRGDYRTNFTRVK